MTAITFDTLEYARQLKASGIPDQQAEAQADALKSALAAGMQDVAAKADIAAIKADINRLEGKIDSLESKLDSKLGMFQWVLLLLVIAVVAPQLKGFF